MLPFVRTNIFIYILFIKEESNNTSKGLILAKLGYISLFRLFLPSFYDLLSLVLMLICRSILGNGIQSNAVRMKC